MSKRLDKLRLDLEKARRRRDSLIEKVKELEEKVQQEENVEIHDMVHAANISPEQLAKLLETLKEGLPNGDPMAAIGEETNHEI